MTRPAKPAPMAAPEPEPVSVRVTKRGDGKISTGRHLAGQGDLMFERGRDPAGVAGDRRPAGGPGPRRDRRGRLMAEIARFVSQAGVRHVIERTADGQLLDHASQDAGAILDINRAMAAENDGYSPTREMRRVASIPLVLILRWRTEEGWDAFDPAHADRLARKLNDPEFHYLRTAPGRVGALAEGGLR